MSHNRADAVEARTAGPSHSRRSVVRRRAAKLAALTLVLVTIVVVPFVLFGEPLDRLAREVMASPASAPVAALTGSLLLAADVVLPVPSTVVISVLGGLLGALSGTLVAAAGLTLGCVLGYGLGRRLGHDFAERTIGREDFAYLSDRLERYGVLLLALCRPVPVLAEASVIAAGVAGLAARPVLVVTTLANVGFAAIYAALGAAADTGAGLIAAVVASLGLPLCALIVAKGLRRSALPF